jgi:hypothetical protein
MKKFPDRMWVRIANTDVGICIDADPSKTWEENVKECLRIAEIQYRTCGLRACAKIPVFIGVIV